VQFADDENKSLQAVCDIVSNPQKFAKAIELMCTSDAWEGMLSRKGWELTHLKERELASTMTTIARFLTFLSTPAIAASTRSSTFDPFVINEQKTTVYFILPPEKATVLSPLLRLWTASMLRAIVKGGLQEKNKVHFICDEANLLGKMNQISDALTFGRGFGLRLQLYYQDCGQLKRCWPEGAEQTLLSNTTQIFFGVNDNETAKYVSERLGESTIVVQSHGSNTGRSHQTSDNGSTSTSYSTGTSENRAQQGRHLLKPDEVMSLSARIAITFTPGVAPIWTRLLRHYESNFANPVEKLSGWTSVKMFAIAFLLFAFASMLAMGASVVANESAERSVKTQQQMFYP
jgi:type IV secretion system protein VirD4